jgi:predicted oxidoreductase
LDPGLAILSFWRELGTRYVTALCTEIHRLVDLFFGDMVKIVVDVRRRVAAVGGELHADAEQVLLAQGSAQADLWGANYYPGRGPDGCLEYTALIGRGEELPR